jgi:hypothetical protein
MHDFRALATHCLYTIEMTGLAQSSICEVPLRKLAR